MIFDPVYIIFALPGFLLAGWATLKTKQTFSHFSQYHASSRLTGAQSARQMLNRAGIQGVSIEPSRGFLSDHYDPTTRTLRLSEQVYNANSLSAIGVACHEAGHAIQHATGYKWLTLRSALVPATNIGSSFSWIVLTVGLVISSTPLMLLGVALFSVAVLFSLITLPVEWDASARAKRAMIQAGIVLPEEAASAGKVLNAAFLTYVAAAVSSILTLAYFVFRAGLFSSNNE